MPIALLFPRFDHSAIEERYAAWSGRTRLERSTTASYVYEPERPIAEAASMVDEELCLVVTDPMMVAAETLSGLLERALAGGPFLAAVPVTNETRESRQRAFPAEPYLTMRQFEEAAARAAAAGAEATAHRWGEHDPGVFLAATSFLSEVPRPAARALEGEEVAVVRGAYVHRWSPMRAQERVDLLDRIPAGVRSILELGCAEGLLGAAVKQRQKCRYVGIELDRDAGAIARHRLDDVYTADVDAILDIIDERFEWIVAGDVLEHLRDPWSTLASLRDVTVPGGSIILSVPNAANWAIVADLLRGRLDYGYIGIACAGHLRFFTRQTIRDAMEIAGWEVVSVEPQLAIVSSETTSLVESLRRGGLAVSEDDLLPTGFYVTARNPTDSHG